MSTPLPGPSVIMNLTGRLGQASAAAVGDSNGDIRNSAAARIDAQTGLLGLLMDPPGAGRPFVALAVAALTEISLAHPSAVLPA